MNASDILRKAERHLRSTHYRQVIRMLEPKILLFNNDSHFYYLLGSACYFTGDVQGAQLYLNKGLVCAEDDVDMRLILACTSLRRRDTALALQLWLEVDDLDPGNKRAKFGLTKLKTIKTSKDLSRFIMSSQFQKLLPIRPLSPLMRVITSVIYTITLMALLFGISFLSVNIFRQLNPKPDFIRDGVSSEFNFFQTPPQQFTEESHQAIFILSSKEITKIMDQARNYFNLFQDDLAGRELNKILLSNASSSVKNQALLLKEALQPPTFATYTANFTFDDVASQPLLYQGLHVLWRGPINGLNTTDYRIAFRLLVGYEDGKVLDGAVEVLVPFEASIAPNLVTNVLGKVVADNQGKFYLEAVSINQIVLLQ
ncbi:hypothetical protein PVA45_00985 [Entomospira entomophila]|uniref:Tetratricopeptide repeat protein n=1 Tax=Entomospira entomophila TaxID=2719988 RepID=A0A968KVQ8_9SPIO|nr:hypothetical protein [Entomospira entomophilus]NIZ40095.1 hypothetical protein [Entomospira entomophilus]WDI35655.1 hypothetical protein PVA45_00985 [Entomospira entomophilus]